MKHLLCSMMEVKANEDSGIMSFEGYGAAFGNVDSYGDVIAKGAFKNFLSEARVGKQGWPSMLSQHGGMGLTAQDMTPIGVWTSIEEDETGLKVSGQLADTPRGREIYTLMKMSPRPAIDGLSIGYIAQEWEMRSKPSDPRRLLKRIDLAEISPVTFPANRSASVNSVKSLEEIESLSEVEDYLREAGGFSRAEAKMLVARIKNSGQREADTSEEFTQLAELLKKNTLILKGN